MQTPGPIPRTPGSHVQTPQSTAETGRTLNELEHKLAGLERENFELKMSFFYQKQYLASLRDGEVDWDEREEETREQLVGLEMELHDQARALKESNARCAELERVVRRSGDDMQSLDAEQREQADTVSKNLKEYDQRLRELETSLRMEANEREKMNEEKLTAEERVERMIRHQDEKEKQAEKAQREVRELHARCAAAERDKGEIMHEHELQLHDMLATLQSVEQERDSAHEQRAAAADDILDLRRREEALEQEIETIHISLANAREQYALQHGQSSHREATLQARLESCTRHSIELEHELHDVKSACRKLAEEKEGLLDAARDVQQSSTSREGWWNTQLGQLKVQLEQREVEVERLKQALHRAEEESTQNQERIKTDLLKMLEQFKRFDGEADELFAELLPQPSQSRAATGPVQDHGMGLDAQLEGAEGLRETVGNLVMKWRLRLRSLLDIKEKCEVKIETAFRRLEEGLRGLGMRERQLETRVRESEEKLRTNVVQLQAQKNKQKEESDYCRLRHDSLIEAHQRVIEDERQGQQDRLRKVEQDCERYRKEGKKVWELLRSKEDEVRALQHANISALRASKKADAEAEQAISQKNELTETYRETLVQLDAQRRHVRGLKAELQRTIKLITTEELMLDEPTVKAVLAGLKLHLSEAMQGPEKAQEAEDGRLRETLQASAEAIGQRTAELQEHGVLGGRRPAMQLLRACEELQVCVSRTEQLVEAASEMLGRHQGHKTVQVGRLLQDNAQLTVYLHNVTKDVDMLLGRKLPCKYQSGKPLGIGTENNPVLGNQSHSTSPSSHKHSPSSTAKQASSSGFPLTFSKRSRDSVNAWAPGNGGGRWREHSPSRAASDQKEGRDPVSQTSRALLADVSSRALAPLNSRILALSGASDSCSGSRAVCNLDRIQRDLVHITQRLGQYKSIAHRYEVLH